MVAADTWHMPFLFSISQLPPSLQNWGRCSACFVCQISSTLTKVVTLTVSFLKTLNSFGAKISLMTLYHPQGNGTVERFNWSLLQMYVQNQADCQHYLPLVLFPYSTAVHLSTWSSPFKLMFGCPSLTLPLPPPFDVNT